MSQRTCDLGELATGLRALRAGHDRAGCLSMWRWMLADGGVAIGDLAVVRDQPELFGAVASTATAWRVLDAVDGSLLAGLGGRARWRGSGCGRSVPMLADRCRRRCPAGARGRVRPTGCA